MASQMQVRAPQGTTGAGGANPLVSATRYSYNYAKDYVVKSANMVPEKDYRFRPTSEVRTFGQIVAYIAESNFLICSSAVGEKDPHGAPDTSKNRKRRRPTSCGRWQTRSRIATRPIRV
jgi:hypothetical protein